MSDTRWAIETRGLVKLYGKTPAVNHLNLKVPAGSVFAFLGRNGAGKTSTIRMLLNLMDRTEGEAYVLGMDPCKQDLEIKRRIGYVAEGQQMYGWMTVSQLIWFCSGFYPTWDGDLTKQLLEELELPADRKIRDLSRGTQAKVALLLAMAHRPELLILDEPTAGLDVVVRREFIESVIDLIQQEGRTVFFSSHLVHEVERVADWVGIIDQGKLVAWGELDQLKSSIKRFRLTFEDAVPASLKLDGVLSHETLGRQMRVTVKDFSEEKLAQVKRYKPCSIDIEDLSLEDILVAMVGEGA